MYRPKFCAECGERVARARWRVWTSRSFCQACERRFRKQRIGAQLAACAGLAALGFLFGWAARRPAPPPLTIVRGELPAPQGRGYKESGAPGVVKQRAQGGAPGEAEPPTDPLEIVTVCGARTKKGTPCSRRVRGAGRCWQHRGKSAMLPPEKLIVRD